MQLTNPGTTQFKQQEHEHCLLCNHTGLTPLTRYFKDCLIKCDHCDFVFCSKIPSDSELVSHYNAYPRNELISSITLKRYQELLAFFKRYRDTGNILDVGCGNGHFLSEAKSKGWNVYGTEYTDTAIDICKKKGINMFQGKLNPEDFGNLKFDVICSIEVLEHINNPTEEIKNFHYLLRDGGIVYITTPNFNSLSRLLLKEKWSIIEYPEHLCYYTSSTLARLFRQAGFKKMLIKTTGISMNRFRKSSYSTWLNETINNDESLREKTESKKLFAFAKKLINSLLTLFGIGDTLKGVFIKKTDK